jgi:hypothetical protein
MTKTEALAAVRQAVIGLLDAQGSGLDRFRAANAQLAKAQLDAANVGASSHEITEASSWNGIPV